MLADNKCDFFQFTAVKAIVCGQLNWIKPEFGFVARRFNMDMRRLATFVAEKMESISSYSQNSWHSQVAILSQNLPAGRAR
jgi:hypothetical protein